MRDEGIAYADALEAAGVPRDAAHFEGGVHGFMTMPMLDIAHEPVGRRARNLSPQVNSRSARG